MAEIPFSTSTPQLVTKTWAYTQFKVIKRSFKWTLDNFSSIFKETGESVLSPTFPAGSDDTQKWSLRLYPFGEDEESKDCLSVYLEAVDCDTSVIRAEFKISLLNALKEETNVSNSAKVRTFAKRGWGFTKFIPRDLLVRESESLLPNDKLTLCCEVSVLADPVSVSGQNIRIPECDISDDLGKLLEGQTHGDVILISADGQESAAHKGILAARSPVFFSMFEYRMKENILGRVEITDMDHEVLRELLRYIYTGKVPAMDKKAESLLVAADKYSLDRLKVMCEDHLCSKLCVVNAAKTLALADMRNAELLKAGAMHFIKSHLIDVMDTAGWREMPQTNSMLFAEVLRSLADHLKLLVGPPLKRQKL